MALQLAPSTLSVPKKGSTMGAVAVKDTAAFLGVSSKANKKTMAVRTQVATTPTPVTTAPGSTTSSPGGKKTLRKGVVVITGASSGLGPGAAGGVFTCIQAARTYLPRRRHTDLAPSDQRQRVATADGDSASRRGSTPVLRRGAEAAAGERQQRSRQLDGQREESRSTRRLGGGRQVGKAGEAAEQAEPERPIMARYRTPPALFAFNLWLGKLGD